MQSRRKWTITVIILVLVLIAAFFVGCKVWPGGDAQRPPSGAALPADRPGAVVPGGEIRDGSTVVGEVKKPNDRNTYDLILDDVQFSLVEVTGNVGAKVLDGRDDGTRTIPGAHQHAVEAAGRYRLEVTLMEGEIGSYSFRLVTRKSRSFDVKVGDEVKGRLDLPGRIDVYTVDAGSARRLTIGDGSPCQDINLGYSEAIDKPSVATPALVCWDHASQLLEANRIVIAVWSEAGRTGEYSFRIEPAD